MLGVAESKSAGEPAQSKRFAYANAARSVAKRLDCGDFSAALAVALTNLLSNLLAAFISLG